MIRHKEKWGLLGGWCLAAVASAIAIGLYQRVRAFDAANGCDVLAGRTPVKVQTEKPPEKKVPHCVIEMKAEAGAAETNVVEESNLKVDRVAFDGESELRVTFNKRPDMESVRQYVRVGPLREGVFGFRYTTPWSYQKHTYEPTLVISGDFAYRTNITLRILKGYPLFGKGADPTGAGALENDFVYSFRRSDPKPELAFADNGRYLPPGGRKALRVSAISITNVATAICRVEPRNIVQLLAREEGVYRQCSWQSSADCEDTDELSGAWETGQIRCVNRPCEQETRLLPVVRNDGGPSNGVFLVAVRNGDLPRDEASWKDSYNPNRYRLVCLSDIGLSVRRGANKLGVWAVSLMTGQPIAETQIEVYSSANTLIATGLTDAKGWCEPTRCAKGEPFAVVAYKAERSDMTFVALRDSMTFDETPKDGLRPTYLTASDTDAFVWTERGIYRHDEKMFVHVLVRNGERRAPKPMPLVLTLQNPLEKTFAKKTVMSDSEGALSYDGFAVPAEQPSGSWSILVSLPGENGRMLARREVKIEEFAPPQIRVTVNAAERQHPTNFTFGVSAEHLFGGPASSLKCAGAVVFEDVPFAPVEWKGYTFGNDERGLSPCFRRLSAQTLDANGRCSCAAPLWADAGRPKAAVRATGQGVVFEDGGRPVTARKSIVCHYYPFYVGSTLPSWLKMPEMGKPKIKLVCVDPDGKLVRSCRQLVGKIERIESVYSYRKDGNGACTWDCTRVRSTVAERIAIPVNPTGEAEFELPLKTCGDYVFTAEDPTTGASFGRAFYLSDWGDDVVRAPLRNPTEVVIQADKAFYRVGDRPRLVIKSPFTGFALMSVLREDVVYTEILNLTNATSEVVMRPLERDWAPNVDVAVSVVQSVAANAKHLAARAHGQVTVPIRPVENELLVNLETDVKVCDQGREGSRVTVDVEAAGADFAVVTLVDEGINLLTGEERPNPVGWLSRVRTATHPLYDLYGLILPVADDRLKANGVKTGGGFGAEMLGRVSPVPTRRFKPLALWQAKVALAGGRGRTVFDLPEFVGEVRVTTVAYSASATGSAAVQRKVTPKLVMQPDAPRFVAPDDAFDVTLPLRNCSAGAGEITYEISSPDLTSVVSGRVILPAGGVTTIVSRISASKQPKEMSVCYKAVGLGEKHASTLLVPVRPAVAWRDKTEVVQLEPQQVLERESAWNFPRFTVTVGASPMAELSAALEWLLEYPYGCLEQTCSRIFPLISAGGILNSVASKAATNRAECVTAGVRRVESMVRDHDFVMWPDCDYPPWDREVSLYAAHFLLEAEKSGQKLSSFARGHVLAFLRKWALNANTNVSAYACHTLALAGVPEKDRMFRLYDGREKLSALARARLARAFAALRDEKRAKALMTYAIEPQSVKEAAFSVLALLDIDPADGRLPALIQYLTQQRDRTRCSWGTTSDNAHALLAIGAYYQHHPARAGDVRVGSLGKRDSLVVDDARLVLTNTGTATAFLSVRQRGLGDPKDETDEAKGLFLRRRFLREDGTPVDLAHVVRGELLVAELTITTDVTRVVGDLVVQDLFAGAFEPVHRELEPSAFVQAGGPACVTDWVMRKDARDDRMLVFSKKFELKQNDEAKVFYPVRVVSAGDFILPGASVEGMYHPDLHARCAPRRLVVGR